MKIIIIGAGAAGLMAAHGLTHRGIDVVLLEAENRIGGRIHTFIPDRFSLPVEAGAEFVHGELPLTLELMRKAGLKTAEAGGSMYRFENGLITSRFNRGAGWDTFYKRLEQNTLDLTLTGFLDLHFPAEDFTELRREVIEMAQGLDLADPNRLSVKSIAAEWLSDDPQFRPIAGYGPLLDFLHRDCALEFLDLKLATAARTIHWQPGSVEVFYDGASVKGEAVIVTASIGSLRQNRIAFYPELPSVDQALQHIGFGSVIKFAIEFAHPFWETKVPDLGFLFTGGGITFWTQRTLQSPILTGWIGQGHLAEFRLLSDDEIVSVAMRQLESTFGIALDSLCKASKVFRYDEDSPSAGAYSWMTLHSASAMETLNRGIADTVWFAGEALHPGDEVGTVEAALQSGLKVARML